MDNQVDALNKILVDKGTKGSEMAARIILEGIGSEELRKPLQYLIKSKKDVLRPTLVSLACEAVGGNPEKIAWVSAFMIIECYCLGILDDIADKSAKKSFYPTFFGRFGVERALIVSGLLSSKASYSLSRMAAEVSPEKYAKINEVFHEFIITGAEAEIENANLKRRGVIDPLKHYSVLEKQAADIEACTSIGAIVGGGSEREAGELGNYGKFLGTIIRLREDLNVALNLTVELSDKIRNHSFPYPLVCAMSKSQKVKNLIDSLVKKKKIEAVDVEKCVSSLFETGVTNDLVKLGGDLVGNAVSSLEKLKGEEAARCLGTVAQAQGALLFRQVKS
ncbi:MAG: polyprenyl synthetase family protein [Candidatus Bathyarchaeota archaeon]